jgi:hypothetical protein
MPAFIEWDEVVSWFAERYKCNRADAKTEADRQRRIWSDNKAESPIMHIKVKCARTGDELPQWKGRKTPPAYLKFGLIPENASDDDLCVVLARGIGKGYATVAMLKEILAKAYGKLEADSKRDYIKKHLRSLVKYCPIFKVYRLAGTKPPRSDADVAGLKNRRNADLKQYGNLPADGLYHVLPGKTYARDDSQMLAFIMSANPNIENLGEAEGEFNRIRRRKYVWEYKRDADDFTCGRYFKLEARKANTGNTPESAPSIPAAPIATPAEKEEDPTLTDEMRDFISDLPWLVSGEFWRQVGAKFDMSLSKVLDVIRYKAKEEGLVVGYNTVYIRPANMNGLCYCGTKAYERWKVEYEAERMEAERLAQEARERAERQRTAAEREVESKRLAEELRAKQEAEKAEHIAAGEIRVCGIWLKPNGYTEPTPEQEAEYERISLEAFAEQLQREEDKENEEREKWEEQQRQRDALQEAVNA